MSIASSLRQSYFEVRPPLYEVYSKKQKDAYKKSNERKKTKITGTEEEQNADCFAFYRLEKGICQQKQKQFVPCQ